MASLSDRILALSTRIGQELKAHAARLLPTGGTTGQVLAKTSATNYAVGWSSLKLRVAFPCVGKPAAGEVFGPYVSDAVVSFPAAFAGSIASAGTAPTASAVFTVKKGTTTIGTLTIATSGATTWATTSGVAQALAAGDRLTITAPATQDSTLADVGMTLVGTV